MRDQRRQERDVGDDAADVGLFQPAVEPVDRDIARRRPGDHLGQHGVVVRRDRIALAIAGVDAQAAGLGRQSPGRDLADRGHEIPGRVLRIDARLDGVAVELDLILLQRQRLAEGDAQLPFDEVDAGDQLGHGMLDLEARVHLDEEHVLAVGDELDGAGADIVHRARRLSRGGADRLALGGIERRRRRLLDHLLVPALQRAFALEQRQQIAVAVADDLHFDVAGIVDVFFDQHAVVAERGLGLALGADDRRPELGRRTARRACRGRRRRRTPSPAPGKPTFSAAFASVASSWASP